jgi:DNA topoisomerase-3
VAEAEALINDGTIGPLQGFRSKIGRPFAAILKLTPDHRLEFDFGQSDRDDDALAEAVDFSDRSALGACPKCGGSVYEHGMSYICERTVGPARSCDFRSGKIILQQEVGETQMRKLLAEGRTDLLDGFISSRTRRKFKAFLVREPGGRIGFEFAPRPAKPGSDAAGKAAPARAGRGRAGSRAADDAVIADDSADDSTTTPAKARAAAKTGAKAAPKAPAKRASGAASKTAPAPRSPSTRAGKAKPAAARAGSAKPRTRATD